MKNNHFMANRRNSFIYPGVVFLLVFSAWVMVFFLLGINQKPATGDEIGYINRGVGFLENGWRALSDGWRPPLLPLLVAFVNLFVDIDSLLNTVRVINISFVSVVPALWIGEYIVSRRDNRLIFMALLTALWPAYYFLAFSVYAEAASFLLLNILLLLSIRLKRSSKLLSINSIGFSLCLAMLFLFKANNVLVSIPFGLYILFFGSGVFLKRAARVSVLAIMAFLLISPWLVFLKNEGGEWVATTTGGYNLLVGTGHHSFGMGSDNRAIHRKYLFDAYGGEFPRINSEENNIIDSQPDKYSLNKVSSSIAMRIWSEDTREMLNFSIRKVMHSYGMSFRGVMDYVVFLLLASSIVASVFLLCFKRCYDVIFLTWSMFFVECVVSFFWLPNIRFKVFYCDTVTFYLLASFVSMAFHKMFLLDKDTLRPKFS
ncbi:hypothetical protein SAMN05421509_109114 [Chromohalobacter canadensis]|uniref:Dolichyl-phosphate-mannose-protein mannosyltransferase n=1 Tax=Chromohalobacter canadensis TaxID=141389 RepID=A0A285VTS8_9GAMM|nr:hypothetical protein [Chromohalobacter canadensis]SOC57454.1 hypothetical protein SAMN05421509_109114 [Chromohalobacter canadensis]